MKVTVIVPIYNAEKYLNRCLNSIVNQSYKDLEIILIDDGSKDGSSEIYSSYLNKDNRIKVIKKENAGQSHGRNHGIRLSTGDYITFVDADDYLSKEAIETLIRYAQNGKYDIVSCLYNTVKNKAIIPINVSWTSGEVNRYGNKEMLDRFNLYKVSSSFGYVWNKLYKRSFIVSNNLKFDDIRKLYMEDTLFNLKASIYDPKWILVNEHLYNYCIYENSTSHKKDDEITDKIINFIDEYMSFLRKKDVVEENINIMMPLFGRLLCWCIYKSLPQKGFYIEKAYIAIKKISTNENFKETALRLKNLRFLFFKGNYFEGFMYSFCFIMVKLRWFKLLAYIFNLVRPLSNLYVKIRLQS